MACAQLSQLRVWQTAIDIISCTARLDITKQALRPASNFLSEFLKTGTPPQLEQLGTCRDRKYLDLPLKISTFCGKQPQLDTAEQTSWEKYTLSGQSSYRTSGTNGWTKKNLISHLDQGKYEILVTLGPEGGDGSNIKTGAYLIHQNLKFFFSTWERLRMTVYLLWRSSLT